MNNIYLLRVFSYPYASKITLSKQTSPLKPFARPWNPLSVIPIQSHRFKWSLFRNFCLARHSPIELAASFVSLCHPINSRQRLSKEVRDFIFWTRLIKPRSSPFAQRFIFRLRCRREGICLRSLLRFCKPGIQFEHSLKSRFKISRWLSWPNPWPSFDNPQSVSLHLKKLKCMFSSEGKNLRISPRLINAPSLISSDLTMTNYQWCLSSILSEIDIDCSQILDQSVTLCKFHVSFTCFLFKS